MKRSGIALLVASVLLPGCASFYQQPGAGEKSAQLAAHIQEDRADFFTKDTTKTSIVEISGYTDAQCTPGAGKGRIVVMTSTWGEHRNARLAVGRRLYLQVERIETSYKRLTSVPDALNAKLKTPGKPIFETEVTTGRCVRVVSFEPEAGKSYDILVTGEPGGCVVSLADASTDQAPPDLQEHAVRQTCMSSR